MNILKAYGVNNEWSINCYDALNDKHASSYFYAKSVKRIVPQNRFSILENVTTIDPKLFKLPDEKYFGANFTKLHFS